MYDINSIWSQKENVGHMESGCVHIIFIMKIDEHKIDENFI